VQISISTRHGQLTEETKQKLRSKAEKLDRFFERLTAIEIVVDLEVPQKPKVDLNVSAEHKHDFVAHEQHENLLSALEAAVQKVEQQLRKYKERVQERHRNPDARRVEAPIDAGAEQQDET
jgi:putative sigma-54 modulation protein